MMNMRKYLIILLFLCFGKAIYGQNDVQPLLLYKAEQDARCRQWVDSVMNRLSLRRSVSFLFIPLLRSIQNTIRRYCVMLWILIK